MAYDGDSMYGACGMFAGKLSTYRWSRLHRGSEKKWVSFGEMTCI